MLTIETALQILAPAMPRRRVSAPGLAHPKPLNANSNQRMERQLAFVLLGEPVQRQRGSFAGLSLHRCQSVLQSSLLAGSQGFDAPAIPPWFTNVDRSLPSDFANVLLLERASFARPTERLAT